ncbi:sulfurtransferase TusA [Pseudohaliea rubra]|nr:sulfurtransferase TusA [Pseudohaliea rubra]
MTPPPPRELDARGLYCPEPVMLLHNAIRDAAPGDLIAVRATDPTTRRDIPQFCHFLGHELVDECEEGGELHFLVRKAL